MEVVPQSRLARYVITSLLQLTSNLIMINAVNGTFITNAMEVAMRMLETGKKIMIEFGRNVEKIDKNNVEIGKNVESKSDELPYKYFRSIVSMIEDVL